MAKKKKSIQLASQDITFILEQRFFKLIRLDLKSMIVETIETDANGKTIGLTKLPFAHIPREIKKIIKPN
jgi:hypothetical protein